MPEVQVGFGNRSEVEVDFESRSSAGVFVKVQVRHAKVYP